MATRLKSTGLAFISIVFLIATFLMVYQNSTASTPPAPYSSLFYDRYESCHDNDSITCNGCHEHGNRSLNATTDKAVYQPGEEEAVVREQLQVVPGLCELRPSEGEDRRLTVETMLEAHQDLVRAAPENQPKFSNVIEFLGQDLRSLP